MSRQTSSGKKHNKTKPCNHSKQEVISIVYHCAELYEENLNRKNILFIFSDKNRNIFSLEVYCNEGHFRHLTGVETGAMKGREFYRACIDRRLKASDIEKRPDGTTDQKLDVLTDALASPVLSADTIADFIQSDTSRLKTDKLIIHNNHWAIGFKKYPDQVSPVPNTFLNERSGRKPKKGKECFLIAAYQRDTRLRSGWTQIYENTASVASKEYHYPDNWGDRPRPIAAPENVSIDEQLQ